MVRIYAEFIEKHVLQLPASGFRVGLLLPRINPLL